MHKQLKNQQKRNYKDRNLNLPKTEPKGREKLKNEIALENQNQPKFQKLFSKEVKFRKQNRCRGR